MDFYAQPNYHVRMMATWRFFSDLKHLYPQTHAERTLKEYVLVRRKSTTEDGMKIIKSTMSKLILKYILSILSEDKSIFGWWGVKIDEGLKCQ